MMSSSKTLHYLSQYISDTKAVAYYTSNVNIVYNTITSNYTSNLTYAPVYTYDTLYSYVNKTSNLFDSNIKIPYNEIVSVNEIAPNEDASTADYFYYSFTDTSINASNYITFSSNTVCDVLIVGGGGSGAVGLGGGSSGGLLYTKGVNIPAGQYPITVGMGGNNGNGGASSAFGAIAYGGLQATTLTGATNNGVNDISNSIITTYDKNSTALAGGASQYTYQGEVAYAYNTVISATGTTAQQVSGNSNYYYYAFTTVGAGNSIVFSKNVTCDILVVGGGGGGGMNAGAGGGAGGLIFLENINISYGTYEITVGAGGQGGKTANVNTVAENGNNSIFGSYIAIGGGGGGNSGGSNGNSGGSGGGAGNDGSGNRSGGAGTLGQGFKGGDGTIPGGAGRTGGGGGGAGGEGQASVSTSRAGDGGIGSNMSLTFGTSLGVDGWFAGGGGGGVHSGTGGTGGNGGGGSQNVSGIANTGGGGGAGNGYNGVGKDGGSGIVIIRVPAIIQESGNITSNLASGGGGIGSSGETILVSSSQTQINGGSGFQVSIRKPNEFFAGGGGANGGKRVPMTGYTIGYGGNSSELSGEKGGDGIIIVSIPISKDIGSIYNTNKIIDLPSASTSLSYGFLNNPSYYYYSFTDTTKTNYINFYKNTTCDVLIVGGGGSGAIGLGGGSSGGLLYSSNVIIPPGEYPITVGAGGKNANDGNGGASTAFGATVYGGMKATTIIGATKYLDNNITGSIISSAAINKTALGGGNSQNVGLVTYLYDQIITAVGATAQQVSGNISYYYYTFTSTTPGANSITFSKDITCDILLVGGGGAGNSGFGGGSAGAVIYYNNVPISSGTYQITVGNGGQTSGENGTSSTFYNAIAFGGRGAITIDGASSNIGSNVVFNNGTMVINEQAKSGGASYTILADPFFNDTSNLLAWYKFDGNADDSSGNNKHLTLYNNPTPPYDSTITIDGSSVNIDGDTYLQNSTSGTYFTPSNLSISFWLYGGSQSTTHQAILSARKGSPQGGWIIYIPPSTNNISFWVGANPWNTLDVTVSDLFSTSWKFFTITYSSTNALKIYKNGVSIYSGTLSTSSRAADNFRIGAGVNEQAALLYLNNGSKIDDCRIYNKILSVDEISILYNRPKSVIISGGGGGTNSITGNGIQYTIGNIPNGGSPISLDITGTNINVAGGGGGSSTIDSSIVGLQQGTGTYGYGGNSRFDTFTPGGSGVVIIRTPTIIDVMDYSYQSISSFSYNEVVTAVGATPEQVSGNPDYYYYAFTDSTAVSKSITFSKDTVCDILIVGGGGGGGGSQGGGGGGAGGLVFYPNALLNGTVQINIGSGGAGGGGGYNGAASAGENGGDSSITINDVAITAVGGGGGGQGSDTNGNNGGSGGGKRVNTSGTQSSSTQPTGDNAPWKGYGNRGGFNIGNNNVSGGGGGAGEEGYNNYGFQDTTSTLSSTTARNEFVGRGGDGLSEVVIDGTTYNFKQLFGNSLSSGEYVDNQLYFAGGGAGSESAGKTHICIGGIGGGADSAAGNDPGNHASPNTGGGGSGGNNGNFNGNNGVIGGNGGSGIVIIRVPAIIQDSVTLNVTTATGGGGIGSLGESITELTTPETPINGGAGFPVSIRAPNELFAGGGGANGGTRIPASGKIIGYGGNSSDTTAEDGGDGIVIIRFAAEIEEENPLKSINKITGSTTTILDDDLTPNKIVITDSDGKINTSNNITLTEFEYLSGVQYDIQQQFTDTSNYYDIMSSNINSNILATSNAIIDNLVNIEEYFINTSNNLSSNINSLNLENINVIASTRKVIVNNTYNDDLTINAKLTVNSNLNISGTTTEIFAPVFNTEALEINTLISLPNPLLKIDYTGTSNILEIYSNTSIKTVVSNDGFLGIGNTNPQFSIDVSSNINISGKYKINGTDLSYYNMSNIPLTFNPSIHDHVISDITDLQTQLDSKQDIIPSISSSGDTITIDADVNLTTGNNYTINGVTISSSGEVVSSTNVQSTQYIDPIIEGASAKIIPGTSYQYAAFTNVSATNSIRFLQDTVCDVLIVGGGGAGGYNTGGGGGAGACIISIGYTFTTGNYTISVGKQGNFPSTVSYNYVDANGGDSIISKDSTIHFKAVGGGAGGAITYNSLNVGGCSGGNGGNKSGTAGLSILNSNIVNNIIPVNAFTSNYGIYLNKGGDSVVWTTNNYNTINGAGGGGIGAVGANSTISASGTGGDGLYQVTINGILYNFKNDFGVIGERDGTTENYYIGGGGGGGGYEDSAKPLITGGKGGGGAGYDASSGTTVLRHAKTYGAGGGGGAGNSPSTGGNGFSGIVIIRWDTAYTPKIDSWKSLATTTLPIINSYNFYNETSNLLVWYKFDQEPSNNLTLTNYGIGNGTSSTYDGIVTMNGAIGATLTQNNEYYPDTNNYNWSSTMDSENFISVNNAPQLLNTMMTSDYSISFWKTSYDVSRDYSVYAHNDATIPATDNANSLVRIHAPWTNNLVYYDNGNFAATTYNRLASSAITGYTGVRQLYTFTRKITGVNEILSVYINGVLLVTGTYSLSQPTVDSTAKFYIGLNKNATYAFKNKSMGDFRIYNRVITTAEMGDLYNIARKTQIVSIPKQINNYTSYYEFKTPVGQINTLTKYPRELMTANTLAYTDGKVVNVVASSFYPATENNAFNAFNGILNVNGWHTSDGKYTGGIGNVENVLGYKGEWLMIDLGEVIMIDSFKIYQRILAPLRMPKKFRFYASNDINAYNNVNHSSWKIIYEDTGTYPTSNTIRTCTIGSSKPYRYFFIVVNENYNDGWVQIAELEIYGFPVTSITTTQFPRRPMSGSTITYNFNGSDIIVTTKSSSIYQGTWLHSRVFDGVKSGNDKVWISGTNPYLNGQYPSNGTYYAKSDYRGEYIMIDLGEDVIINQMKIWRNTVERSIPQRHPRNYRLYGTNNTSDFTNVQSENWTEIFDKVDNTAGATPANNPTDDNFSNILSYRYYALVINKVYATTGSEYVEIYELEMFSRNSSSSFKTNTITFTKDTVCDVLVVGGGGSGGVRCGGGGGAGACIYMQNYTFSSGTYNIVVGDGGASVPNSINAVGNHGDDSYIQKDGVDIFRAIGGGGGGYDGTNDILPGGSSGGAAASKTTSENISILNIPLSGYIYGNKGGIGLNNANTYYAGGGGGGADNVGGNAVTHSSTTGYGGAGGEGRLINITGRELYYAAGGGGGIGPTGIGGQGGSGIGGNGSVLQETALNGLANTGSGGGGSGFANGTNLNGISGAGGSGIVIIRWNNFADNSHINYNDVEVYNNNVVIGKTKYLDNFKQYGEIRKYPPIASTFTSTGGSFTELSSTITGQLYGNGTYVSSQSTILGGYSSVYLFDDVIGTDAGIHDASKFTSPAGNISSSGSILNNTNYIGEWIKFKIPSQIYLAYVKIYGRSNLLSRSPSFYRVYGSNDDINWTLLIDNNKEAIYNNLTDTNNSVLVHKTKIANLKQSDKFLYFALCINKIKGYGVYNDYLNFSELEFYGSETFTKVDMVSNYDFYTDTTDMKVWYKLEDLNDSSGNGLTLINSGATFDTTVVGNYVTGTGAIQLGTSASAYVKSPYDYYFSGNTSFTYAFWLKSNNNSANNQVIINSRNNTTQGWNVVRLQNESTIYFEVFKSSATATKKYEVGSSWNHFVCVLEYVSTTQQNMSFYMNGVFQEVKSGNIYDPYVEGALYFGKSATGTAYPVADNTFIDDFRMYNRVLNFDEIQILYYRRKIQDRTVYSIYNDKTNLALQYDFDTTNVLLNKGYLGTSYNLTCVGTLQSEYGAVNLNNNSYLSINSALDTTGWTECSICFRLKRTALNTSWDVIFYHTIGQTFIIQRNNTTSTLYINIFGSGGVYTTSTTLNDYVVDNIWNHYVFVFNKEGTQVRIKIYKNGNFDPVFTSLSGTWTTDISNIAISRGNTSVALKGLLDDVRIYDRVLTTGEIQTLNEMAYNEVDKSDYIFNGSTDYVSNTSNNMIVPIGNIVTYTGDIVSESGKINTNNLFINQNLIINTSVRDYSSNILTKYPGNPLTSINSSVEKFTNPSINILAWYKFDGNLLDSSGNNRHLTGGTGTSFTSDCKLGNSCISFPNTAAQTVTSSTLSLAGNTSFTISLWTKRATAAKNDFMICAGTTAGTRTLLLISYTTTNYVQFACYNDDFKTVNTYADVNTWVHWTFVYNGTTRLRQIYRNGILENSSTASGVTNFAATFNIGNRTDALNGQFSGLIDDVRVFNRDLTPEEIATIYNINPTYNIYNTNKTRIGWDTGSIGLLTAGNGTYPHLPSISISYKKVIASGDIIISDGTATTAVTVNGKTITIPAGYQIWTVPITGSYKLVAGGARGMYLTINTEDGKGIVVSNMVSLTSGEKIIICVGKTPRTTSGSMYSGGGGTFISKLTGLGSDNLFTTLLNHTLLLVAGGGGGAGTASTNNIGTNGVITTSGTLPTGIGSGTVATNGGGGGGKGGAGGNATNGLQGSGTDGSGAGGGGFIGNGGNGTANTGGKSFLNGAQGGITPVTSDISTYAGFGGGGGSWNTGGGGGGYSGGNSHINSARNGGGGGGSYDINGSSFNATQYTNWDLKSISAPSQFLSGYSIDNGFVAIEQSSYASNPVSTTNYITGYPGEYLKLDMGEYILPEYIAMTPVTNDFYTNTSNLIAWYKFDGNLLDSSGNNKHLTLYNNPISVYDTIIYNSGISSINFDGDTYLEHLATNYFTSSGDITYSIWIYGGVAGTQQTIFSAREGNNKGIVLFIMADQKIGVYSGNSSWGWAGTYTTAAQVPNLSSNSWKHIVIIKKTDNTISIYYNNVALILNSNPGGVPQINSSTSLRIGGWGITDNAQYLSNGTKIDDFRIYNRALTVNEISILSNLNGSQLALMPAKAPKNFRLYGAQTINNAIIYHNGVLATPLQVPGSTDYYFAFTSTTGQHSITFTKNTICEILVVGGGGGGGNSLGGGGGAGAVVHIPSMTFSADKMYSITIGDGGLSGIKGNTSSITANTFNEIKAEGGGTSGSYPYGTGTAGGSGGGAAANGYQNINAGGGVGSGSSTGDFTGVIYQNIGGGNSSVRTGNPTCGGGGGGAGSAPGDNNPSTEPGHGGDGIQINIDGNNYYWGGGGGSGLHRFNESPANASSGARGGKGGGGGGGSDAGDGLDLSKTGDTNGINPANNGSGINGGNGGANTGGGGGGGEMEYANGIGGKGGSGIVIIRWRGSEEIQDYTLLLDNTTTSTMTPSISISYPIVATTAYRYFTLVVKDNWESSLGTAISELEIYGYEQSPIYTKYPRQAMSANTLAYTDGSGVSVRVTGSSEYGGIESYYGSFTNFKYIKGWGTAIAYNKTTGIASNSYVTGYAGEYIMIDLGEQIFLNNIKIYPRTDGNTQYRIPKDFKIFASNSSASFGTGNQNNGWTEIYTGSTPGDGSQLTPYSYIIGSTTSYRYFMMVVNKNFGGGYSISDRVQIAELELYGTPGNYVTSVSSSKWKVAPSTDANELEFSTSTDNGTNWITRSMISATATGGYTNFTGIHHCKASSNYLYDNKYIGRIVSTTKKYSSINSVYGDDNIKRNLDKKEWDCLPIVELSSKQNDKNVFGIITKIEDNHSKQREYQTGYMKHYYDKEEFDRRLHIAGVGEGGIWVCDYNTSNSNIESGDYITSSPILGFGMKQHDDLQHSYTVAKATMDCDFNPKLLPVKVIATSNILVETIDNTPTIFKNVIIDSLNNEVYTSNFDNDIKCMFELYNLNSSSNIQNNINVSNIQYDINIHNININNSSNTLCNINFYYGYLSNYIMINDNIDIYDVNSLKTADITSNSSNNIYYKIYLKDENDEYIYTDLLDDAGNIIYEYEYELQYIYDNGEYITKEEYDICISNNINVYKTAFIGCTYHCS